MIHHTDTDAADMAAERALATAHFLEQSARAASADGDLRAANALHAGAMALAALGRRRAGRDDAETADLDRRAILASGEFMPLA